MRTIRQQDVPSLLVGGSFVDGAAGWDVDAGVTHVEQEPGTVGSAALVNAPTFGLRVPAGASIRKTWSRTDLYRYPSRRFLGDVLAWPGGINTYFLLLSATTRLDGRSLLASGVPEPMFWAGPPSDPTTVKSGAQIEVRDVGRDELDGPWRVGRFRGSFLPGGEILEASPIERPMPRLASSADYAGATYVYNDLTGGADVVILGAYAFARPAAIDGGRVGFQPGDMLVFTAPSFAVMVVDYATAEEDRWRLRVRPMFGGGGGLSIAPALPVTGEATAALGDWFVAAPTLLDLARDLPLFQYDFTLAFSYTPAPFDGSAVLEFVDRAGNRLQEIPAWPLAGGTAYEDVSTGSSAEAATVFRRRLMRFFVETKAPVGSRLRLTLTAGTRPYVFGDVVLHRGDYTRRHDFDDRDDATPVEPPDRRSALDRLFGGVEHGEGAPPRGTTVLYVGSVCPPGWKRVDSIAGSAVDGLETLPKPDEAVYDAAHNRTTLRWRTVAFDELDAEGRPILIADAANVVSLALPSAAPFYGAYESVDLAPARQRVQPGMSLRVRVSNLEAGRPYAYSTIVRRAFAEQTEETGPAPTSLPPYQQLDYPVFMRGNNFDPPERAWDPLGPDKTQQPTTLSTAASGGFTPTNPIGTYAHPAPFAGLVNGAATLVMTGVNANVVVGQHVYVRWTSGTNALTALSGAFIGTIVAKTGGTVTVSRYDGRGMVVHGASGPRSGQASMSDPKIFDPAVRITRTPVNGEPMWSARRFARSCVVDVAGDATGDVLQYNDEGLVLEPSGYVRYLPGGGFSPGSGGHSHEIVRGDAVFNENVAPHVNAGHESIPPTPVARKHGHGFMPGFVHPAPPFFAALLCEKL